MQSGTLLAEPALTKEVTTKNKPWWTELDGLRALAFLLVFYSHTTGLFWRADGGRSPLYQALFQIDSHLKNWGWIGVDLFFVLSAFLITSILLGEREKTSKVNLKNFLTRRVLRIWPLYYFYLAVIALSFPILLSEQSKIGLPVSAEQHAHWAEQLCAFLVFLGNYSMIKLGELVTPLNPLWSLCIEEQFYIIWGLTMTLVKTRRQAISILLGGIALAFAARAFVFFGQGADHTITHLEYYVNGLTHMDSILMGALSAFIWTKWGETLKASKVVPPIFFALALATTGGIIAFAPTIESKDPSLIFSMFGVALGWTFFLFATLTYQPVKRFFSLPALTHIGRLTYGLYIFHFLAIYCVLIYSRHFIKTPGQSTSVLLLWGLALPLTYGAARLSWRYLEEPFIKLKSKF